MQIPQAELSELYFGLSTVIATTELLLNYLLLFFVTNSYKFTHYLFVDRFERLNLLTFQLANFYNFLTLPLSTKHSHSSKEASNLSEVSDNVTLISTSVERLEKTEGKINNRSNRELIGALLVKCRAT
jgi:hypothetical protein